MRETTRVLAGRAKAERERADFTRYSAGLREALIAGAEAARESGEGVTAFAAATGVSAPTLFWWLRERRAFVRVKTTTPAPTEIACEPAAMLTVTDPQSGVQVTGCTVAQAAELLRALRG